MITATYIKDVARFTGTAKLYRLSEPAPYGWDNDEGATEYVIVSAANAMFSGPETYIFPANDAGEVTDWTEMDGSYRGGLCHESAIASAGWILADAAAEE
jgi:hypothetical protein